jgi:hypothetical protein
VVTQMEIELFPMPDLFAGWLVWAHGRGQPSPPPHRGATMGFDMPDKVTSTARSRRTHHSQRVHGRELVIVDAALLTTEHPGSDLLEPLRDLDPEFDTFAAFPQL